jgi:hypothetical protein
VFSLEKALGYGPDAIRGTASFGNVTHADLVDHLIGLKPDIEVLRITLTKKRFGILSAAPFVDDRPVSVSFTVNPTDAILIIETESGTQLIFQDRSVNSACLAFLVRKRASCPMRSGWSLRETPA